MKSENLSTSAKSMSPKSPGMPMQINQLNKNDNSAYLKNIKDGDPPMSEYEMAVMDSYAQRQII